MQPVRQLTPRPNLYWMTFGFCALGAACIFLPFLVVDKGFFLYCGDFNSQYISFTQYANAFVKEGGSWSWATDMGSGFVNSYSYYLLGSPFFWLSCILPASWQPYLMVPMLCLKYAVAGGGAYLWVRRYARRQNLAVIAGCLYAFSGFTIYNTFFFTFVDGIALFPYLLWALDEAVYEDRRGLFAFVVAVNFLNNYFFFAGQIVFLALYFICKCTTRSWHITPRLFGRLAFESLLGSAMGCVLAWPALLSLSQNPRTVNFSSGYGFLLYGKVQQYFAIFYNLFFPPDPPYLPNMFTDCTIKHTSMTAYLPLIGFSAALAWLRTRQGHAFRRLLFICGLCAMVPVLNSAFYALNSSYYARWWYMPVLILCGASMLALEDEGVDIPRKGILPSLIILLSTVALAVVPVEGDEGEWTFGVLQQPSQYWLMLGLGVAGLLIFWMVLVWYERGPRMPRALLAAVLAFSCLYSVFHFAIGKFPQWERDGGYRQECYVEGPQLAEALPEGFYRTDTYETFDNLSMWTGISNLQFFSTTVEPSIMEFYPQLGVKRDVSSKPEAENYALRGLLSVRFTLMPLDEQANFLDEVEEQGWTFWGEIGSYAVYENENWVPMGFTYDSYITQEQLDAIPEDKRSNVLMRALVLDEEQIEQYGSWLTQLECTDLVDRDYDAYAEDAAARRASAADSFVADNYGFTATITLDSDNLVFFSVPCTEGWTATVNGETVPVEKVSGGMIAVPAGAGENTIRLDYHTPGLAQSAAVAGTAVLIWLGWMAWLVYRRRKPAPVSAPAPVSNEPADSENESFSVELPKGNTDL